MYNSSQNEEQILEYWDKHRCFEKSVEARSEKDPYHFYDGPPFATGLPHYGHIVASLIKDIVPRFWTMRGKRVERRWGWDCHGLPIENIIEKDLQLNSKKDIEELGIDKFNEACRATVLKYATEWKKTVRRIGRWVDMENDYKTMDLEYMESVWWVFRQLWDRQLIYKGHKAMHICPRCVTPLSNFEVTQGYKDIKDLSVTAKFKLKNPEQVGLADASYILAWTTTPWTLPGNMLLAVKADIKYVAVKKFAGYVNGQATYEQVILAKDIYEKIKARPNTDAMKAAFDVLVKDVPPSAPVPAFNSIEKEFMGQELVGLEYEPLFPYFKNTPNAFKVVAEDFVTITDGTGVVHIAPAFGEDDYEAGKRAGVPLVQHVSMDGRFIEEVEDFAGHEVKPREDHSASAVEILKWLAANGKLFAKEKFEHSYPHCWRCDTPLLNYAASSWFVKVTALKDELLRNNADIRWVPHHIKEGRFGLWLAGARDWAISRNRYWGTPLPVWESDDGDALCVGSVAELEELTGKKVSDLHKHVIDDLTIEKDGKLYRRIPEVLDCWFESGSMPYGQMHYPFENKEKFEAGFPAEFIAEGQDQTRGWFYTLHVLATALTMGKDPAVPVKQSVPAFRNVIVNGIVLAEDGKKMSKHLKNYPDPDLLLDKYGADAMRYYLATAPVMAAEALNFSEADVREVYNKVVNTLWNVVEFYKLYAPPAPSRPRAKHILDKWILSKLQILVREVTQGMEEYKIADASRPILDFITELSQWYVRRSRDRFKGEDSKDKARAVAVLREVLLTLSQVMAPFTPFIAEKVYLEVGGKKESVHWEDWPRVTRKWVDEKVLTEMAQARKVVEMGLALRAETGIKVKQPLLALAVGPVRLSKEAVALVADELNVGEVVAQGDASWVVKEDSGLQVALNTEITPALKQAGLARSLVRAINQERKNLGLTMNDVVRVFYATNDNELRAVLSTMSDEIKKNVLASVLEAKDDVAVASIAVEGKEIKLVVEKES